MGRGLIDLSKFKKQTDTAPPSLDTFVKKKGGGGWEQGVLLGCVNLNIVCKKEEFHSSQHVILGPQCEQTVHFWA